MIKTVIINGICFTMGKKFLKGILSMITEKDTQTTVQNPSKPYDYRE
jgi:hypothetical protein